MNADSARPVEVRVQLLGPVRLVVDGEPVSVGGPGRRGLLAVLALRANRVVTLAQLIDTLWEHDPPATARTIVHGNVSQLRRVLGRVQERPTAGDPGDDEGVRVETTSLGYRLVVEPDRVDAHRVRALLERARAAPLTRRAELLERACALWRGHSLGDVPESVDNTDLRELWCAVYSERVDALLELGTHAELVGELSHVVNDDPAAERTVAQLMRALYYSGRRGDALRVYRRSAEHITGTLGITPGHDLVALHEKLLHDDMPASATPNEGTHGAQQLSTLDRPVQLPAAVPALFGRDTDIDWLEAMRVAACSGVATVGVLSGAPGVGKTALLVSWAHRAAGYFPDGVLFASLHAGDPAQRTLDAADVLHQFLRGLGVTAADMPEETSERVALYRTLLHERAVLVLLDDADSAERVVPLLPAGGRCMAVVTGRARLEDLTVSHAARHRVLATLDPAAAIRVVSEVAGPEPVGSHARIAQLCGNLPLALRLAGARLAAGAQWSAVDLVREMEDEHSRLAALEVPGADNDVRAALDVSYRGLSEELAATLRGIGVLTVDSVGPHHLAAVCAVDVPTARRRLRTLVAHSLLTETARDVFAAHDLVRLYARERASAELGDVERAAVFDASLCFYLAACDTARRRLLRIVDPLEFGDTLPAEGLPEFDSSSAAEFFEREWNNILRTLETACAAGHDEQAWQLARIAHTYRVVHPWWQQWSRLLDLGAPAARRAQSMAGMYWMHISRCAAALLFDYAEHSLDEGRQALRLASMLDEERPRISAGIHVGCALNACGRHGEAIETLRKILLDTERLGDPALHGQALNNCAEAEKQAGLSAEAIGHQLEALRIDHMLGDHSYVVVSLNNLAEMHLALADLDAAQGYAREAVKLAAEHEFILQEGVSRITLGRILRADGAFEQAYDQLSRAVTLHERVGSADAELIRTELDGLSSSGDLVST